MVEKKYKKTTRVDEVQHIPSYHLNILQNGYAGHLPHVKKLDVFVIF